MIISSFDGLSYSRGDVYGLNSAATLSKTGLSAQNQSGTTSDQDAIERAFETASIGASEFVAADMKARILEADLNSQTYVERALILRFQSAQALSKSSVNEAIKAQNLILASRGEPPITPAEERALESRAHAIVKQRIAFLDAFTKAADAKFVKIRI
ncbi:MAG: hypothetical protein LBF86_04575 [Helicobacteraceae bacterium]|nr:hypothetical protein [Helicobacteraceae bacterium]